MRKLKLKLDDLRVESLAIPGRHSSWGTVIGRAKAPLTSWEGCMPDETSPEVCPPDERASIDILCPSFSHCETAYGGDPECC